MRRFMLEWVPVLLVFGIFFFAMPAMAQTRTNTKELSKALQKVADQKREEAKANRQEADRLSKKAHAGQAAVDAARRKMAENNERMAELDRELNQIKEEKVKALGNIVWDIMNDPKIGHLVRAKTSRIRMIPAIKGILTVNPWLDPVLEEILKDYQ